MEGSSSQSGSSSSNTIPEIHDSAVFSYKTVSHENFFNNSILLKLEENGFTTPDEKAEELIKRLAYIKYLYALKLLFENLQNEFSPQILRDTLVALADPTPFDFYAKQSVTRLELHLRTWVTVLERICFSPIVLSKELRDKVYNSLSKFAEIHRKTTQVIEIGLDNNFRSNFNQLNQQSNNQDDQIITKKRNYNIDFLLIHLRDTLHSLRDDETWFQEIIRRTKNLLKTALNITPGILTTITGINLPSDCSILSMLNQVRESLSFKYPVASYYVDWRIMLIIQHNLFTWSEGTEMIISKKFCELSTRTATYGLCYYLAIESLNKAPSSFIQFKAVEILLHLHNIDSKMFSMIDDDFDQYIKKLKEIKSSDFSEKFQNLLLFIKEKYVEDLKILSENIGKEKKGKGKGKSINQNSYLKREQISNSNVIDIIADEMTCPVSSEPEDQLCILKCQHTLSLNNLKLLKQKICPKCREKIEENDIRYLPQSSIFKNLYTKFSESGHIMIPPIKLENSDQIYDSDDSDNSEADLILAKKKKSINSIIKLNSNISLSSILPKFSKKQHPTYQNIIKEINEKHYEKAESLCKEFLNFFPKSYSLRCILGYIYRCLKNYEQAHFYLKEAINLKPKQPIAYLICGEIFFWQCNYKEAINNLQKSIDYKAKINNLYIILGNSFLFSEDYYIACVCYNFALKNNSDNYLCFKNNACSYEKRHMYSEALNMLDKLLNINKDNSLILCYYGEILCNMKQYKLNNILTKINQISNIKDSELLLFVRCKLYVELKMYYEAKLDLNLLYVKNSNYYKYISYISYIYLLREYTDFWLYLNNNYRSKFGFNVNNNNHCSELGIVNEFSKHTYKRLQVYFISNLVNLKSELYQFQENDINSLSEKIISSKNEGLYLNSPMLYFKRCDRIIWKINIKKILKKDCFIKFVIKSANSEQYTDSELNHYEHVLKYEDVLKLEGLGWIEYQLPKLLDKYFVQPSIEISGSINMQIDYFRCGHNEEEITYNLSIDDLLPNFHKFCPNVPETFKNKYFSKKAMENLLELKDIINHL
ncbi:protein prenylyltransferase [Rhizophagus irregularis]|nr:protein prenylyltransferase [Rhizophagus irregularis]